MIGLMFTILYYVTVILLGLAAVAVFIVGGFYVLLKLNVQFASKIWYAVKTGFGRGE